MEVAGHLPLAVVELGQSQVYNARMGIIRGVVCPPSSVCWVVQAGRL